MTPMDDVEAVALDIGGIDLKGSMKFEFIDQDERKRVARQWLNRPENRRQKEWANDWIVAATNVIETLKSRGWTPPSEGKM